MLKEESLRKRRSDASEVGTSGGNILFFRTTKKKKPKKALIDYAFGYDSLLSDKVTNKKCLASDD